MCAHSRGTDRGERTEWAATPGALAPAGAALRGSRARIECGGACASGDVQSAGFGRGRRTPVSRPPLGRGSNVGACEGGDVQGAGFGRGRRTPGLQVTARAHIRVRTRGRGTSMCRLPWRPGVRRPSRASGSRLLWGGGWRIRGCGISTRRTARLAVVGAQLAGDRPPGVAGEPGSYSCAHSVTLRSHAPERSRDPSAPARSSVR